jgi:hypothetical protein
MYFTDSFTQAYEITPGKELHNAPHELIDTSRKNALDEPSFTREAAERVVARLGLTSKL